MSPTSKNGRRMSESLKVIDLLVDWELCMFYGKIFEELHFGAASL